tara:strand:- start:632 stop:1060 length:429 start_codon:yes stop_codon:yes gene_type:complete
MKITIIAVGKLKEKLYRERVDEYLKWINKDTSIELILIKNSTQKKIKNKLLSYIKPHHYVICLSEEGEEFSSIQLSNFINKINQNLIFLIGGPAGHSSLIKKESTKTLSLSKLTFPHEMSLLILTEQIYRAFSIMNKRQYHR